MMRLQVAGRSGYSVVELMIALGISLLVTGAAYVTYVAQSKSYVSQEAVSEISSQSKIALDIISDEIQSAGFGAWEEAGEDSVNGVATMLVPSDSSVLSDSIMILHGFNQIGTITVPSPLTPVGVASQSLTMQVDLDTEDPKKINLVEKRFISIDGISYAEVRDCPLDASDDCALGNNRTLTLDRVVTTNIPWDNTTVPPSGRPVYRIEDRRFCVDDEMRLIRMTYPDNACSYRGLQDAVIAENVEDLQLSFAVQDTPTVFVSWTGVTNPSEIVAVRISLLVRTDKEDPNFAGSGNRPAVIENRNHAQTNDGFKRRLLQAVVGLRKEA